MTNAICICCGNEDAVVTVSLDADHQFHCNECGADFDTAQVEKVIASWGPVLKWLQASPFRCEVAAEAK